MFSNSAKAIVPRSVAASGSTCDYRQISHERCDYPYLPEEGLLNTAKKTASFSECMFFSIVTVTTLGMAI
ncbi:hypothetical protein LMG22931_05619 [Paraburkholderia nemoris]|nr:hypothetical protein LMG22931_05619 [Paraburkholderia nemoris]